MNQSSATDYCCNKIEKRHVLFLTLATMEKLCCHLQGHGGISQVRLNLLDYNKVEVWHCKRGIYQCWINIFYLILFTDLQLQRALHKPLVKCSRIMYQNNFKCSGGTVLILAFYFQERVNYHGLQFLGNSLTKKLHCAKNFKGDEGVLLQVGVRW